MEENKQTKSMDEIFCRSCGVPIKKEAEICPHCGVRNTYATPISNNVLKDYNYGSLLPILYITGLILILISSFSSSTTLVILSNLVVMGIFIASIIAVYKDAKTLGAQNPVMWAVGVFLLWIIMLPVYIFKRKSLANQGTN